MNRAAEISKLKKSVQKYKNLDKDIGMYSKAIKKLKERKETEYNNIFKSMQKLNIKKIHLDTDGGTIQTCYKKKREGLNKKFIQGRIQSLCENHGIDYEEAIDWVYNKDHRKVTEFLGLKKSKARKNKN